MEEKATLDNVGDLDLKMTMTPHEMGSPLLPKPGRISSKILNYLHLVKEKSILHVLNHIFKPD